MNSVSDDQRAPALDRVAVDRRREVLVVDDEPDIRDLLVEFFRELDFRVASASDGRAALTTLDREPDRYWLVITDIVMPGADGLSVLRAAKQANPELHVVIITGYASLDTAVEAVRLGAFDYLSKPFTLGEIEVMLHRLGQRVQLEQENRRLTDHVTRVRADGDVGRQLAGIAARLDRLERVLDSLTAQLGRR